MRKMIFIIFIIFIGINFGNYSLAESGHDHSEDGTSERKKKNIQEAKDSHGHDDHEEISKENHAGEDHKEDDHGEAGHDKDGHGEEHGEDHEEAGHDEDGDGEEHEESSFGEGKAILDVKKDGKKFRLASSVIKILKIQSGKVSSLANNVFEISSSSIVEFQDEIAVYKRTDDWFELVEVKVLERSKNSVKIMTKELLNSDEIVNEGVALLRVAHLQASGQGGKGHAH